MPYQHPDAPEINRRSFVKASIVPAAYPLAAAMANACAKRACSAEETEPTVPEIIDTNVHLFEWPFRALKYDRTRDLIAKLRKHRITKAWAGSFEALLHKQLDTVNRRLADECQSRGEGVLVPVGSVNPAWPDWQEDLRRCHEQYRMHAVRLYPSYHGYMLDDPELPRMIDAAARRGMIVQIAMRMEDERVHHPAIQLPPLNAAPLADVLKRIPESKVQLINAAGPLLGSNLAELIRQTPIMFDIAAVEGNGGVGRLIEGTNPSYQGAIPLERLTFGSHAPFFPCESALLKLFESPLRLSQLEQLMNGNARRMVA